MASSALPKFIISRCGQRLVTTQQIMFRPMQSYNLSKKIFFIQVGKRYAVILDVKNVLFSVHICRIQEWLMGFPGHKAWLF